MDDGPRLSNKSDCQQKVNRSMSRLTRKRESIGSEHKDIEANQQRKMKWMWTTRTSWIIKDQLKERARAEDKNVVLTRFRFVFGQFLCMVRSRIVLLIDMHDLGDQWSFLWPWILPYFDILTWCTHYLTPTSQLTRIMRTSRKKK